MLEDIGGEDGRFSGETVGEKPKEKKMKRDSGATTSIWMATAAEIPSENKLLKDAVTDVCIVGAGIAGMTTAYLLAREGKRVIVLDDGPIGGGMTGRTTAHL